MVSRIEVLFFAALIGIALFSHAAGSTSPSQKDTVLERLFGGTDTTPIGGPDAAATDPSAALFDREPEFRKPIEHETPSLFGPERRPVYEVTTKPKTVDTPTGPLNGEIRLD